MESRAYRPTAALPTALEVLWTSAWDMTEVAPAVDTRAAAPHRIIIDGHRAWLCGYHPKALPALEQKAVARS
jgi:hypothetical protein